MPLSLKLKKHTLRNVKLLSHRVSLSQSESILFLCKSSGICCGGHLFLKMVNFACFIETCYVATSLWVTGRNKMESVPDTVVLFRELGVWQRQGLGCVLPGSVNMVKLHRSLHFSIWNHKAQWLNIINFF